MTETKDSFTEVELVNFYVALSWTSWILVFTFLILGKSQRY